MRRIQLLSVVMVAAFAVSILTDTPALAVTFLLAEWLVNGSAVTSELSVDVSGELSLEDTKALLGAKAMVLCSGTLDGWVGPNGLGWVSEILSLGGVAISSTPLSGTSLECEPKTGCESNTLVLVWPLGMPWETVLELAEDTTSSLVVLLFPTKGTELGWEITKCLVLGVENEDECHEAESVVGLALEGTTLFGGFSDEFTELMGQKLATCLNGGTETGVVEGEGSFSLVGGGTLSASSESVEAEGPAHLGFEFTTKLEIKENATAEAFVEFIGSLFAKETGVMSVSTAGTFNAGLAPANSPCMQKSIKAGEHCLVKIECNGGAGQSGEVLVEATKPLIARAKRTLECVP